MIQVVPLTHPPFPYMAFETSSQDAVWLMGADWLVDPTPLTPVRLANTQSTNISDPMLNPQNRDEIVMCLTPNSTPIVCVVDLTTGTKTDLVTLPNNGNPQPYWHPGGEFILYRKRITSPSVGYEIRRIKRDGTGDTLIYSATGATLSCACYSPSGNYIAFGKGIQFTSQEVWMMAADGTADSAVASTDATDVASGSLQWSTPYSLMSWQNNADVLGWMEMGVDSSGPGCVWRKVNADGTGLTTLLTTALASSPDVRWMGCSRFAWLLDDSAMVSFKVDGSSDPRWRLAQIDGSGGGDSFLGSNFSYGSFTSNPYGQSSQNISPVVYRDGDGRIYWSPRTTGSLVTADVVSVAPDGSDLVTDDDGTVSPAHGHFAFCGVAD